MTLATSLSTDAARAELAGMIEAARAAWTAYALPVESENRGMIDLAAPEAQQPFLSWEIAWRSGVQASLGVNPLGRQYGQLVVAAKVKEGTGSSGCQKLLDHLAAFVENRQGTLVNTGIAQVHQAAQAQGWYALPMIVVFWYDRIIPTV